MSGWLTVVAIALGWALPAAADMAMTRIIEVRELNGVEMELDGGMQIKQADTVMEIVLEAGMQQGLLPPAQVTILRPGEAIVHPLNGKVIGVPEEPVGVAQVYQADDEVARAVVLKAYKPPRSGDMAEYRRAIPVGVTPPPPAVQERTVDRMMARVRDLENQLADRRRAATATTRQAADPRVWDEIHAMKSYLLSLDERLVSLEERQAKDRQWLSAVTGGDHGGKMEELTLRYSADTQVRVQVAGKTLTLRVEEDRFRLDDPVVAADAPGKKAPKKEKVGWLARLWPGGDAAADKETATADDEELLNEPDMEQEIGDEPALAEEAAETPWYDASWIAPVMALVLVAVGISIFIEKRMRQREEELDLEDYESEFDDDDLLYDDDDDDDEEEEDDEEYAASGSRFRR